jgi:hypothetical protein
VARVTKGYASCLKKEETWFLRISYGKESKSEKVYKIAGECWENNAFKVVNLYSMQGTNLCRMEVQTDDVGTNKKTDC